MLTISRDLLLKMLLPLLVLFGTCWLAWNYYDVRYFIEWATIAEKYGVIGIYSQADKCGYMPLSPILFVASYELAKTASQMFTNILPALSEVNYYRLIIKMPLLISIVLVGYIMYRNDGWNVAKWWFYGVPVWVVLWTYQFDPIMLLFMLIGTYSLIKREYFKAGLWLGIGAAFKYIPALIIPFGVKIAGNRREKILLLLGFLIPVLIVTLPFLVFDISGFFNQAFGFHMNRYPQMLSIFNIPQLLGGFEMSPLELKIITLIWLPLFITFYIIGLLMMPSKSGDKDSIMLSICVLILSFMIFNKVHNGNYLIWVYPYLSYWIAKKNSRIKALFIIAGIVGAVGYPTIVYLPAATLDKPVFIEEDKVWYNARDIFLRSWEGAGESIGVRVISWLKGSMRDGMVWVYINLNILGAVLVAAYNVILIYFMLSMLKIGSLGELAEKIKEAYIKLLTYFRKVMLTKIF